MKRYDYFASGMGQAIRGSWCFREDVEAQATRLREQITTLQTSLLQTEQQFADAKENCTAGWECLQLVKECLEDLGKDMDAVPPMFYPEAIVAVVQKKLKEAEKQVLS